MKKLIALLLLLPVLASADPHAWMKKRDPEELSIDVFVGSECPMTEEEIESEARNVFIRSRIKPLSGGLPEFQSPYLYISIQCMEPSDNSRFVFAALILDYVGLIDLNDPHDKREGSVFEHRPDPVVFRHGIKPYLGYTLTADKSLMRSTLKDAVESFIADYIFVNFDLGED